MTDQNSQFFAILTAVGEAKQANANALGIPWTFSQMAVGDAGGQPNPIPDRLQTKLINERRRAALNQLSVDPANTNIIIAEQVIPPDVGGWWIREIALYDADGDMVAVANCAPSFKPLLTQGTGKTQIVRLNIAVTSTANVTLKIDPSVVLATRSYVDQRIAEVLPATRTAGTFTKVTINARGIVTAGSNPTTLAGYGITDAYTKIQTDAQVSAKADKATSLAGYSIADAYTKLQVDGLLSGKLNVANAAMTGIPTCSTAPLGTNTFQVANTAFVQATVNALIAAAPGALDTLGELATALGNDPNFAATMTNQLAAKAPLASPTFTGTPKADTAPAGAKTSQLATTLFVANELATAIASIVSDPWATQPIGVPIPVFDGTSAAVVPPKSKAYRYIRLTAGDAYNDELLTGEVVAGTAPLLNAFAYVNLAASPLNNATVRLINTERRFLRAGLPNTAEADQFQGFSMPAAQGNGSNGPAFDTWSNGSLLTTKPGPISDGTNGTPRVGNETRPKNVGVTYYMRIL